MKRWLFGTYKHHARKNPFKWIQASLEEILYQIYLKNKKTWLDSQNT